ncbi:MAG: hypothetical protein LBG84_08710, partial [Treponema sp.]|nr:hypothetical protein [Treponema sp.]
MPVNAKSFFSRPDFQIRLASLLGALTLVLVGILLTLSIGASLFRWAFVNSRAGDLLSGAYGMFAFMIPLYLFWAAWLLANPAFKPGSIFLLSSTIIPFLTLAAGFSFIKDFETRRNAWNFLDSLGRPGLGLLVITAAILEAAGILILHAFFFNNGMDPAGARLSPSEERRYSPPDSRRVLPEQRRSPPGEDWSAPKTRPQEAPPPAPPRSMEIAADTAGPAEETPLSAEASPARETFLKPRRAAGEEKPVELPEWKPLASAAALEELETLRNEPAPVEKTPAMNEASFIEKTPPVEKTPPLEETPLPLEEAALVEETLPVEETPIMEETPLVEETLPLEEAAPVEETLSLKETPLVEETSLLEEIAPVEETPSPVEETLPVEEAALVEAPPLGAIPPMEEPAPPAAEPLPVEEPLPPEEEVVVLSPAILTPYSRIAALDPGVEVEISAASEQGEEPDPAEPSGEELEDLEFAAEDPELEPELAMADPELELKPEPGLESAVEPVPCEPAAILSAPEEIPAPAVPAIVKKAPPKKCKSPYAIPV